jgi:broad specificity phosphatase PhoE
MVLTADSAGSRDSALTNHGHQQATRLGQHFKALGLKFTHLFSSHLQRAAKTAGLIRDAQLRSKHEVEAARDVPEVVQLPLLMEQDFGDLEGKKWSDMQADLRTIPGFTAVETKEAMSLRADAFLDDHLLPLLNVMGDGPAHTVAIVSHGIFLSTLWKRLLRRLPSRSICLAPDLRSAAHPSLEHLGGWSNTGFLELHMTRQDAAPSSTSKTNMSWPHKLKPNKNIGIVDVPQEAVQEATDSVEASEVSADDVADEATTAAVVPTLTTPHTTGLRTTHDWTTTILTINGKDHLKGLERTGGGVGSSRHDASQKGIESFFKRRKID